MDRRNSLLIYERREVIVLTMLGIVATAFAFTYGIHLGKTVAPVENAPAIHATQDHSTVRTVADEIPNRQELTEQGRAVPQASEESLDEALREEVGRSGAKIDVPKQVDLPLDPKSAPAGATKDKKGKAITPKTPAESVTSAATPTAYTLQVGSFPSEAEATSATKTLGENSIETELRPVELTGKGKWFRVYAGTFPTKAEAEKAGQEYRTNKWISSFIVVDAPH